MNTTPIIVLSVLVQLATALVALRLTPVTGRRTAWILIVSALFLMAVRRAILLFHILSGDLSPPPDPTAEVVGLVTSVLMLSGVLLIAPAFLSAKEAREALRASEERLQEAQRVAGMGFWDWDIVTSGLSWSDEIYRIFGLRPQEFGATYQAFLASIHPDDRESVQDAVNASVQEGADYSIDHRIVLPGGEVRTVHEQGEVFRDREGKPVRMLGTVMDITERKRADEALTTSERRYRELFEFSRDAIFVTTPDGEYLDFNQALAELLGFPPEELRAMNVREAYADSAERDRLLEEIEREGFVKDYEVNMRRKDGTRLSCLVTLMKRHPEEGVPLRFEGILRDITARKQAEVQLIKTNRALRVLSGCNEVLVRAGDEAGLLGEVCKLVVEEGGYRLSWVGIAEEDAERTVRPAASCGDDTGYLNTIQISWADTDLGQGPTGTAIRTRQPGVMRHIATNPAFEPWREKARQRGYASSASLPMVAGEECLGALNIYALEPDAFDPKEVELLLQLAMDLAYGIKTLRARAHQVEIEEQLRQAQKMEALGQLTGGIAHDFNNELTVILLNAQLGLAELEGGEGADLSLLHAIEDAALRSASMTRRLLGFGRQADLEICPTDLASLAVGLEPLLKRVLPESIEIEVQATEPVSAVEVDPHSVEQILINLGTNARDAMPQGGALRIAVREEELDEEYCATHATVTCGRYVCVSVSDNGVGMDEETRTKIFEPFFTTKELGAGTGLGMAMVYGLMKQQSGHIHVYSELGGGTTIRLYFPVVLEEARARPRRVSAGTTQGGTEAILLVEDEEQLLLTARRVLERHGYTVFIASDGEEAIGVYRAHKDEIDLVLSDLVMPKMSGIQLYQALQEEEGSIRFILASGYAGQEAGARNAVHPQLPFVQKPWNLEGFLTIVREVLDREQEN